MINDIDIGFHQPMKRRGGYWPQPEAETCQFRRRDEHCSSADTHSHLNRADKQCLSLYD